MESDDVIKLVADTGELPLLIILQLRILSRSIQAALNSIIERNHIIRVSHEKKGMKTLLPTSISIPPQSLSKNDLFGLNKVTHLLLAEEDDGYYEDDLNFQHFPSATHITCKGNPDIPLLNLPPSLSSLFLLGKEFDQPLTTLPPSLTHLVLGEYFDQPLQSLPQSLTHLRINGQFNQPLNDLPHSLLHLAISGIFNHPINNLPSKLTHLFISSPLEQHVANLPHSLTHLAIKDNKLLSIVVPERTTHLLLHSFSKITNPLPHSLIKVLFIQCNEVLKLPHLKQLAIDSTNSVNYPSSLTHLTLGKGVWPIETFPSSLTHLKFGTGYYGNLSFLPNSLQILQMNKMENEKVLDQLPSSLKIVVLNKIMIPESTKLPPTISQVHLQDFPIVILPFLQKSIPYPWIQPAKDEFWDSIVEDHEQPHVSWFKGSNDGPDLQKIMFPWQLDVPLKFLSDAAWVDFINTPHPIFPNSVTHLSLSTGFNSSIDNLPASLQFLILGQRFNHPVDHLPPSLTHLIFGTDFNKAVDKLPPSLKVLMFGKKFDLPLTRLPPSLTHLVLGSFFCRELDALPNGLTHLTLGNSNYMYQMAQLPCSLLHLIIPMRVRARVKSPGPPFAKCHTY